MCRVWDRRIDLTTFGHKKHEHWVQELGLSDDAASKRIHAARKAREFPALGPTWPMAGST
jgi:hypothetical protein